MAVDDIKTPIITTLTVEVKVLKIGKKQCTIAVFDQLPTMDLVYQVDMGGYYKHFAKIQDWEDWNLWGKVSRKGEWFVVFELNGELYKSKIALKHKKTINGVYEGWEQFVANCYELDQLFIAV